MKKKKQKVLIVDLDMTVSDCRHRLHHVDGKDGKKKDFDAFNNDVRQDTPMEQNITFIEVAMEKYKAKVCIVSTRDLVCWDATCDFLEKHTLFSESRLHNLFLNERTYLRHNTDRTSSVELKRRWIEEIHKKYDVIATFDDNEKVCRMYKDFFDEKKKDVIVWKVGILPSMWQRVKSYPSASA